MGGGASTLVDDLLGDGFSGVTVLDLSESALEVARSRLGPKSALASWIAGDIRSVELPEQAYDIWHDRTVTSSLRHSRPTDPSSAAGCRWRDTPPISSMASSVPRSIWWGTCLKSTRHRWGRSSILSTAIASSRIEFGQLARCPACLSWRAAIAALINRSSPWCRFPEWAGTAHCRKSSRRSNRPPWA